MDLAVQAEIAGWLQRIPSALQSGNDTYLISKVSVLCKKSQRAGSMSLCLCRALDDELHQGGDPPQLANFLPG